MDHTKQFVSELVLLSVSITLVITLNATAQYDQLHKGDRVKISVGSDQRDDKIGTFIKSTSTEIMIIADDYTITIPTDIIQDIAVSRGKKSSLGKGAVLGLSMGGLLGGVIGALNYEECDESGLFGCSYASSGPLESFMTGFFIGGLGGSVGGLIAGIFIKSDRWEQIPVKFSLNRFPLYPKSKSIEPVVSLRVPLN